MTSPRRHLIRMIAFIAVIAAVAGALYQPLSTAFMGNVVINSIILAALFIGIGFSFRQTLRLLPEHHWMVAAARNPANVERMTMPSLLGTVAVMLKDNSSSVSAQGLRSVLDGIAVRLDESREISRYMIGLLVFLGLLGTFWGLLTTVQAVGGVVGGIDTSSTDVDAMMSQQATPPAINYIEPAKVVTRDSSSFMAFEDHEVAVAMRYIKEHACDPITTADVLKVTGMSNSTAYRKFMKAIGRSIHNEIQKVQMNRVKELLTTTNLSITEIAAQAGFDNVRYMTQVFRDMTNQTPTGYRRTQSTPGTQQAIPSVAG